MASEVTYTQRPSGLVATPSGSSPMGSVASMCRVARSITDALAGVTHVLYAPPVTGGQFDFEAGYDLFNAARRLTTAIAEMGVVWV